MRRIGGNITGTLQTGEVTTNAIGEQVKTFKDAVRITGFLDMLSGSAGYGAFNAKIQESTHVFLCNYVKLPQVVRAETARMVIDGQAYDVTYIDDPMGLHKHLEIFLKYTGGQ